tara:strand:- start:114 stop:1157 length:1044 start_codon:yes stop_codon:yes gene_type:complete
MIKSSKSLTALFFLFICFFASSRYIQKIIFDRDILNTINSRIYTNDQSCIPKKDSLIGFYKNNNKKALIIIIDAYPNSKIYKKITGLDSYFHNYLNKVSTEKIDSFTVIATTQLSIPYLLGKIPINTYCRYPFLGGKFKPKLLLNHEMIQSNEGICPKSYNYSSRNAFIRYINRFRAKIDKNYKKNIKEILQNCSISNLQTIDLIIEDLLKTNLEGLLKPINIAHEFKFHRNDKEIIESNDLEIYDLMYLKGIKYLINNLKKSKIIDEIVILNDHGPRTSLFGDSNSKYNSESLIDQNYHGIFAYRIDIKNNNSTKILRELIPKAKERYLQTSFGEIQKLDNFVFQE